MSEQPQPEVIQGLIERFGFSRVYETFMKLHGYPPTWNPSARDAIHVAKALAE